MEVVKIIKKLTDYEEEKAIFLAFPYDGGTLKRRCMKWSKLEQILDRF